VLHKAQHLVLPSPSIHFSNIFDFNVILDIVFWKCLGQLNGSLTMGPDGVS